MAESRKNKGQMTKIEENLSSGIKVQITKR